MFSLIQNPVKTFLREKSILSFSDLNQLLKSKLKEMKMNVETVMREKSKITKEINDDFIMRISTFRRKKLKMKKHKTYKRIKKKRNINKQNLK